MTLCAGKGKRSQMGEGREKKKKIEERSVKKNRKYRIGI